MGSSGKKPRKRPKARPRQAAPGPGPLRPKIANLPDAGEESFRLFVEAVEDYALLLLDPRGRVVSWNAGAKRIKGYEADEIIGQHFSRFYLPRDVRSGHPDKELRIAAKEGRYHEEGWRVRKDGSRFLADVLITALRDKRGKLCGFAKVTHDITGRKEAEKRLRQAKKKAEAADKAKSAFLATMSHEIRTPMNGVIGMTSLLQHTELTAEQREYVETIHSSGEALLTLINDILDFSKIEAGRFQLDRAPFNLRQCVEEIFDLFLKPIWEKRLEVAYLIAADVPAMVVGDAARVRQVLLNLVGNAIKFTAEGEVVLNVTTDGTDARGCRLRFALSDTGIGIPEASLKLLFHSFQQLDTSVTRRFGGTGLGLAISRRLAGMMGGTIEAASREGRGSTFTFTAVLPPAPSLGGAAPPPGKEMEPLSVLVVDDHPVNRRILSAQLTEWGMNPVLAASGQEALALSDKGPFDLALVDYHMPGMDGVELARAMRKRFPVPMILLSSGGDAPPEAAELFRLQLSKPIKQAALWNALHKATGAAVSQPPGTPVPVLDRGLAGRKPLRILLADDNRVNQRVGAIMLAGLGYRADIAANGLEVLDRLKETRYDLVLMDIQMPEMDGIAALAEIRKSRPDGFPRVIALTANAFSGERERLLELGFDEYLSKPLDMARLHQLLVQLPVQARNADEAAPAS